jgi:O-methyltransferase involved in polyketide biosynthesis
VFDYLCEQPPPQPKRDVVILLLSFLRNFFKEVRSFEIEQEQIGPFLASRGFSQVRPVTGADLYARYFIGKNAGRRITSAYAIAVGIV